MANKAPNPNVRCPVCDAATGEPCRRLDGSGPKPQLHSKRFTLALQKKSREDVSQAAFRTAKE